MGPSAYQAQGPLQRLPGLMQKFDGQIYVAIADEGYLHPPELAFFPGWPWLLRLGGRGLGLHGHAQMEPLASLFNLILLTLAVWFWSRLLFQCTLSAAREPRWIWLLLFFPTSVFFASGYAEAAFLAASGACLFFALNRRAWELAFCLMIFVLIKHVAILCGAGLLFWLLLYRPRLLFWAVPAYLIGLSIIFLISYRETGDFLYWAKVQASWGRHFGWPGALLSDLHGKAVDLALYVPFIFLVPFWLALNYWRARNLPGAEVTLLFLIFCSAIFIPVCFGSSVESLYRVVLIAPPAYAGVGAWIFRQKPRFRIGLWGCLLLLNLHATYRFVSFLHLT